VTGLLPFEGGKPVGWFIVIAASVRIGDGNAPDRVLWRRALPAELRLSGSLQVTSNLRQTERMAHLRMSLLEIGHEPRLVQENVVDH
jgi:hypothetical protein